LGKEGNSLGGVSSLRNIFKERQRQSAAFFASEFGCRGFINSKPLNSWKSVLSVVRFGFLSLARSGTGTLEISLLSGFGTAILVNIRSKDDSLERIVSMLYRNWF
jgi:hypothetical protein